MDKAYTKEKDLKRIKEQLEDLVVFAREQAETLTDKESVLYTRMVQVSNIAATLVELGHYPTVACVERMSKAVEGCILYELTEHVSDFSKLIRELTKDG